jgi:hypothetical protein
MKLPGDSERIGLWLKPYISRCRLKRMVSPDEV